MSAQGNALGIRVNSNDAKGAALILRNSPNSHELGPHLWSFAISGLKTLGVAQG